MGDLNAKVGSEKVEHTVGNHGLGTLNERGERWVDWCQSHDQVIMNIWFKNHVRRVWTWKDPGNRSKNQIDFVTINYRFRNSAQQAKAYTGASCGSDHNPVISTIKVKLQK